MRMQEAVREKVSYWLEWRQMGTAYYATMQIEEFDSVESRNPHCVKRVRLTKEQANMPLLDLMSLFPRIDVPKVDYKRRVVMPVHEMNDGKKVFDIVFYGLTRLDLSGIDGYDFCKIALERRGLDTRLYQINPEDVRWCDSHNYEPPEKRT